MRAVATTFLVAALLWAPDARAATAALPRPVTVTFASQTPGLQLSGILYLPASLPAPAVVIVSGTSGREGFQNWEIPWAERLQRAGYVALIEDSFTPRHLAFSQHWRLSAAARGQDALDAAAYLARAPFVRAGRRRHRPVRRRERVALGGRRARRADATLALADGRR